MSGTVSGKIEARHSVAAADPFRILQEYFKNIYDFLLGHPSYTLIARHSGTGSANGDVDYWDGANPFRTKAWYVFKNDGAVAVPARSWDWYVMVQLVTKAEYPNTGVSAPCLIRNADYNAYSRIAIQFAIGAGGDKNPWNGTVGGDGQGVKGSPVWKVPSGGSHVMVFGRSNNPGGSHDTVKQNMSLLWYGSNVNETRTSRTGVLADSDSLLLMYSPADDLNYSTMIFAPFTPRPGLSLSYPAVMLHNGPTVMSGGPYATPPGTSYGGTTGGDSAEGGVPHRDSATYGVRNVWGAYYKNASGASHQPNPVPATPEYDLFALPLLMDENPYYGLIGQIDDWRVAYDIPSRDTSPDLLKIFLGSSTTASWKNVFPWDGVTTPGTGATRGGVNF